MIYFEASASTKVAKTLADETGVELAVLNPLESLTQKEQEAGENYVSVMKENLAALQKAFINLATERSQLMHYIEVENLTFYYDDEPVLEDVSYYVDPGEFVILTGENGAAKSTLIKSTLGLLKPTSGKITVAKK